MALRQMVYTSAHTQEIVAGDLKNYIVSEYRELRERLGDSAVDYFTTLQLSSKPLASLDLAELVIIPLDYVRELPQIVYAFRAVNTPESIPLSLVSLSLIQSTVTSFSQLIARLSQAPEMIAADFESARKLYEIINIPNQVKDGDQKLEASDDKLEGLSVEFREVSFRYPGSKSFCLSKVSFLVKSGQLCVIVGKNGSGKSTVLKLIARLYDPDEGVILVNGRDIRTYTLESLRAAMSILFQDFTHFPVSLGENIRMGDSTWPVEENMSRVREAAELGGAKEFIERLSHGYGTVYSGTTGGSLHVPTNMRSKSGDPVRLDEVQQYLTGQEPSGQRGFSGGQLQRLALSRSFMRSIGGNRVHLALYDEPSASLDPEAEYELFERLRVLKNGRTMIFSSHRFGNLTRHADVIVNMRDAEVVETGTHEELIANGQQYSHMFKMQAQAYL